MSNKIPIFVINLKQDTAKRKHMEMLCKQHHLDCQFIEAVYGKDLDEKTLSKVYDKKNSITKIGRELTKGEIGCALSHRSIYKHMIDTNMKYALIFEDDIDITSDFAHVIQAIEKFPDDWELVLLGYFKSSPQKEKNVAAYLRFRKKITDRHKIVRLARIGMGTHGYLINLEGAKKLIEASSIIQMPIDHYTGSDQYTNLYAIAPRVIRVHEIIGKKQSSIDQERCDLAYDNSENLHKQNKNFIYKLKKEIQRVLTQSITFIMKFFQPIRKYTKASEK